MAINMPNNMADKREGNNNNNKSGTSSGSDNTQ